MSQLIPYSQRSIGTKTVETVDARDLYAFLEIVKDYTSWVKAQIRRAQLIENEDFVLFTQKGESNGARGGNRPTSEYFLTFDAAKHVSMMSGSKKGREAREYFIACEKALQTQPESEGSILVRMAIAYERQEAMQRQLTQDMLTLQAQTIANQTKTLEALMQATRAETKADLALEDAHYMTLEDCIVKNGLLRQFPVSQWASYTTWLKQYCLQYALEIRKNPVVGKLWPDENAYPIPALAALIRHEQRKPRQLAMVPRAAGGRTHD